MLDGFDHDNRIVHHQTNRQDQTEEGQCIDRETQERKHSECADERYGHRQQWDHADHRPDLHRDVRPARGVQPVVVEAIGVVPDALAVDRVADGGEVLKELHHQVVGGPPAAAVQHGGDARHGHRVERHPSGRVGLLEHRARRQVRPVDRADVVQPEEAALEQVVALGILPVHPPGEVDQELVEDPAQEVHVPATVNGEHLEGGPCLHRRVHVAEVPLVGGQGPVGVLEPLPAEQDELVLREPRVQVGQRHAVEGQVPGGEPGVLPLVRH